MTTKHLAGRPDEQRDRAGCRRRRGFDNHPTLNVDRVNGYVDFVNGSRSESAAHDRRVLGWARSARDRYRPRQFTPGELDCGTPRSAGCHTGETITDRDRRGCSWSSPVTVGPRAKPTSTRVAAGPSHELEPRPSVGTAPTPPVADRRARGSTRR